MLSKIDHYETKKQTGDELFAGFDEIGDVVFVVSYHKKDLISYQYKLLTTVFY